MLPSMAYDCVSVVPAPGRNVKMAITRNETASNGRTGTRAPRETASRPAPTPIVPATAAPHERNRAVGLPSRSEIHQGGAPSGAWAIAGTTIDGPPTDKKNITRSETVMQAAAVQTSPRVPPLARMIRLITVFTPQVDTPGFASLRRTTGLNRPYPSAIQGLTKNCLAKAKDAACGTARVVMFVLVPAGVGRSVRYLPIERRLDRELVAKCARVVRVHRHDATGAQVLASQDRAGPGGPPSAGA